MQPQQLNLHYHHLLVFWGVFSVFSRNYAPFVNISFVIALLTAVSSINPLVWYFLGKGGFVTAFISIFLMLFYGFLLFTEWRALYITAIIISVVRLVYTGAYFKNKINDEQTAKKQQLNTLSLTLCIKLIE